MSRSRFPALAALLSGAAAAAAPASVSAEDGGDDNTLDLGQVEAAMATEVDKAAAKATSDANTRWNAVMTSDAGVKNPKAAARMLSTSAMAADDIIATLDDLAPAAAAPGNAGNPGGSAGASRERLRGASDTSARGGDREAAPDTGGSGGAQGRARDENGTLSAREHRQKTAEARNAQTTRSAGGAANVKQAG